MIASVRNVRLHLSKYLAIVRQGEEVIVKSHNAPVARIVPYVSQEAAGRFPDLSALRAMQGGYASPSEALVREDREGRG